MDIKELLANIDSSVLTEESKTQICNVFETVVTEKVESQIANRVSIEIDSALVEQDEAHASQLTTLLEAIDKDHSDKLKTIVTGLDGDHTAKLDDIVRKYETLLTTEAKALTESLQIDISNFLDLTLDELLPQNMLKEAVENTKAAEKLLKIQKLVSVDEAFISEHVREALSDGKEQIDILKNDLNDVLKENVKLSTEKGKIASELVLECKTASLPDGKRLFVKQTFKGKSASYINENFDYALQMFDRKETDAMAHEKAMIISESVSGDVDTPKEEQQQQQSSMETTPYMSEYVSGLV